MNNIYLIGFMGSGKTTWAQRLGRRFGMDVLDLDALIEMEAETSIQNIFATRGEAIFRKMETDALHSTINRSNAIIACGGGAPCFNNNMDFMNQMGKTIYLEASPTFLHRNIVYDNTPRPVLNTRYIALINLIEMKLGERKRFYQKAKYIVDVERASCDTFAQLLNKKTG